MWVKITKQQFVLTNWYFLINEFLIVKRILLQVPRGPQYNKPYISITVSVLFKTLYRNYIADSGLLGNTNGII